MSVGLTVPDHVHAIDGVRLSVAAAGVRYRGRDDVALIEIVPEATVGAVFTQNKFCAAPVLVAQQHLQQSSPKYLIVNAGNANAGTGTSGIEAALQVCRCVAKEAGASIEQVLPFSTGVIGEALDTEKICTNVPALIQGLSADNWIAAAHAIMTTDTIAKACSSQFNLAGKKVSLTGIVKGSGMIRPNMATMLAFVATDLELDSEAIQEILAAATEQSFNSITVDGDTSTNDACVLMATGASGVKYSDLAAAEQQQYVNELTGLMQQLAQAIVRDGEGVSKFVSIRVRDTATPAQAKSVAFSVANSPLVKTALAASDPNWGRIMAAVGYAQDDALDMTNVSLSINDVLIWHQGALAPDYSESAGKAAMAPEEICIEISLGLGTVEKTVWTTDLTHEYVRINAEYRT